MADKSRLLVIKDLRSGRNNVDPPQSLTDTHCVEAINVDWYNTTFGRKRNGVVSVALSSSPFTGIISSGFRHVPGTDETLAELWATDDAAPPHVGRLAGGTAWSVPPLPDAPTGNGWDFAYASFNGLLYIAYKSGVNRLHAWDPVLGTVRRTGLLGTNPPGLLNQGSGSYPATLRYYRTRVTEQRSGITVRRSEPSGSVQTTPSGTGAVLQVLLQTPPNEGETNWEVEASTDNATFYRIATVPIGTTSYNDSMLTSQYSTMPLSAAAGTYTLQRSYKYIAVDQGRLLGFGSWTSTDPQSRIEFSAVLGSSDIGDGERVPLGNYQALDENDSGSATALRGPVNGSFFAGKYRQFWKLTPTGNVNQPYNVLKLSPVIGPVSQVAMTIGEDEIGNAAVYFLSFQGPYRWSSRGIEYLGKPMEDRTLSANSGVSLNLSASHVVGHTLWYPAKRQVLFWFATGASNDPNEGGFFSVGRTPPYYGGYSTEPGEPSRWSRFDGGLGAARCSFLFSNVIGAAMSRDLRPHMGSATTPNTIGKCDTSMVDFTVPFQSYIVTKAYWPGGPNFSAAIQGGQIVARASSGTTITVATLADFGLDAATDTVDLTPRLSESRVQPRIGAGMTLGDIQQVQWQVGDAVAVNAAWQIDELRIAVNKGAPEVS
jgi:hypothetical protein